eukprot:COSAG03_NODE_22039_length_296_cov_0.725888_1_plen_30_part_10
MLAVAVPLHRDALTRIIVDCQHWLVGENEV